MKRRVILLTIVAAVSLMVTTVLFWVVEHDNGGPGRLVIFTNGQIWLCSCSSWGEDLCYRR